MHVAENMSQSDAKSDSKDGISLSIYFIVFCNVFSHSFFFFCSVSDAGECSFAPFYMEWGEESAEKAVDAGRKGKPEPFVETLGSETYGYELDRAYQDCFVSFA
jgi:hypothetical protein